MSKIRKVVRYINEEGFTFTFEPIAETLQIKETKEGYEARYLVQDEDAISPEDENGDDNLFLVAYHRDFSVLREKFITKDQCVDLFRFLRGEKYEGEELQGIKGYLKEYHVFGLEAYIHSGVALSLSYEGNFPDRRWDVSQLGCVFASKKEWRLRKSARKAAIGLIKTWNTYLSGDVYGCVCEKYSKNKEQIDHDSCWGFYGYKHALAELPTF